MVDEFDVRPVVAEEEPNGVEETALTSFDAAAAMVAANVSEVDAPPASVAVTLIFSVDAAFGAVPVKVSVAALKVSHVGSAEPLDCVAL